MGRSFGGIDASQVHGTRRLHDRTGKRDEAAIGPHRERRHRQSDCASCQRLANQTPHTALLRPHNGWALSGSVGSDLPGFNPIPSDVGEM
jgi:hypothetical protein